MRRSHPSGKRNILTLGWVSFLNDLSSEMVYPIIPIFLMKTLGAAAPVIGLIEGCAEAMASLLKVYSGWLSDRSGRRKDLVGVGYALSAIGKALLVLAGSWVIVLSARLVDRIGKGTRTAARDALIADSSPPQERGRAFGLHRAMDTAGAILGPLAAWYVLSLEDVSYPMIFLVATIPSVLAVSLLWMLVRDIPADRHVSPPGRFVEWKTLGAPFKSFLLVSALFSLGNSSDAFLILRSASLGCSTAQSIQMYVLLNTAYALLSYPFGRLVDRFGARMVLTGSFLVFAVVYAGFGLASAGILWLLFPTYGMYLSMSDGVGKAYISTIVPDDRRGTAIGLFHTVTGLVAFLSSLLAGLLWQYVAVPAPFFVGSCFALLSAIVFHVVSGEKSVARVHPVT